MWSSSNITQFQLFGDGTDLVFLMEDGLWVMRQALITAVTFDIRTPSIDVTTFGDSSDFRKFIAGMPDYSANFEIRPRQMEMVLGAEDPFELLNQYRDHSIRDLLQMITRKLEERK